jgi:DNA-binding MarR family transcriptional regulator
MAANPPAHPTTTTTTTPRSSRAATERIALEQSAGFRLSRLVRVRRERWATQLQSLGLTPPQAAILRATRDREGQALRALARTLNTDAMSVKRCVDDLERRGWLLTTTRDDDRRVREVNLTSAGQELMRRLDELAYAQEHHLRQQLAPSHYALLVTLLGAMERAEGIGEGEPVDDRIAITNHERSTHEQ